MNPITLILMLFNRFVPIDSTEFAKISSDAQNWYTKIDVSDESTDPLKEIKLFFTQWYAKLLLGALYFWFTKMLMDWLLELNDTLDDTMRNSELHK